MRLVLRAGLALLAASELVLGVWAQFAPESFYRDFPTVQLTPPYSEHFLRDFGGATLGLAVLLGAAAWWLEKRLARIALVAYLAWAVPHLVFHLGHLHDASVADITFLVISLGGTVLLPCVLLAIAPRTFRAVPEAE